MIQVYTGNGKGKTTAAVGAAIRAIGQGKKVFMLQFIKKGQSGEVLISPQIPNFTIVSGGRKGLINKNHIRAQDKKLAQKGLSRAKEIALSEEYDLLILDELNVALNLGLLALEEVKEFLKNIPPQLEIIITGRNAHPQIKGLADLVSEIKEIKHYYHQGIRARKGIEY